MRGVCGGFHVTESPTEVALRNGPDEPVPPTVTVGAVRVYVPLGA